MLESNRDKIQALQTEVLQDYFELRMMEAFRNNWKEKVENIVNIKLSTGINTYKDIKRIFDAKGRSHVTVTDLDATALTTLIRFDFEKECCPDYKTRKMVGHIASDRNSLSHIPNFHDTRRILNLEKTAIDNLMDFLTHLKRISWNQPLFFRKYMGTGFNDGALNEISASVLREISGEDAFMSRVFHYLQELKIIREERSNNYVGLSYNREGHENEKYLLNELITSNLVNSNKGMRIVAEGGYGKSWTLMEIAGRYAEQYLDEENTAEKIIPIVIEMGKLYKDCSSVQKKIAQLFFSGDESKIMPFLKQNKILLLIDAMDEAQVEIQSDVSRELASLRDVCKNITFVCASRKSCIDKYPLSIPCYAIKLLDDNQINEYLRKTIPEKLLQKVLDDWIGENRKRFLYQNRTPFYISCYVELVRETNDNDFVDTTQMIEKFLNAMIERELRKTGFRSDKATFINFLKELSRMLDAGGANGEKVAALPENDVICELNRKIIVEEGQASIKAVGRKLVEIQILSRDEEEMLLSFAHQNYKEYINRKYPARQFRSWQ